MVSSETAFFRSIAARLNLTTANFRRHCFHIGSSSPPRFRQKSRCLTRSASFWQALAQICCHFGNILLQACVPAATRLLGSPLWIVHRLVQLCLSVCTTCRISLRIHCFVNVSRDVFSHPPDLALILKLMRQFRRRCSYNHSRAPAGPALF